MPKEVGDRVFDEHETSMIDVRVYGVIQKSPNSGATSQQGENIERTAWGISS